ncbi:uncharacterized metal-binding protein YceD (DUF177 family) [Rhodoligotrophos appendicifer]|uniref:DUF177 domain-containing protein n=1 Tax=Rhodoligotrophos appendicifer TaxID=987056 RepID=UPI00147924E3|nr:DUF177 domain-containing protein [Rhodoligotrophos appendicifer]
MDSEFSRPIMVERIGAGGDESVMATQAECRLVAQRLGILDVYALRAEATVLPWKKGGLHVSGAFHAEVEQSCVVTLEPLVLTYEEKFERYFLPAKAIAAVEEGELFIDADEEEPPQAIEGNVVDLGEVVVEELALALDPYPRKADAAVDARYVLGQATEVPPGPFATLAALKKRADADNSDT